jgi:hypothetical protein
MSFPRYLLISRFVKCLFLFADLCGDITVFSLVFVLYFASKQFLYRATHSVLFVGVKLLFG